MSDVYFYFIRKARAILTAGVWTVPRYG